MTQRPLPTFLIDDGANRYRITVTMNIIARTPDSPPAITRTCTDRVSGAARSTRRAPAGNCRAQMGLLGLDIVKSSTARYRRV